MVINSSNLAVTCPFVVSLTVFHWCINNGKGCSAHPPAELMVVCTWTKEMSDLHIIILEIRAFLLALQAFQESFIETESGVDEWQCNSGNLNQQTISLPISLLFQQILVWSDWSPGTYKAEGMLWWTSSAFGSNDRDIVVSSSTSMHEDLPSVGQTVGDFVCPTP